MLGGWFEGRVPDGEDLEAVGDMSMSDLLCHLFGTSTITLQPPQEAAEDAREVLYNLRGVLSGSGPSWGALRGLSASGVAGTVHLRTLGRDVILSLDGHGDVAETEDLFLS